MQRFTVKNRHGLQIVAVREQPKNYPRGTAIIEHGWSGTKEQSHIQAVKNAFLQADFQTVIFDTTNSFGESDGDFANSTLGQHSDDLDDVIEWTKKQSWFATPLALSGHSMGGFAALRHAARNPYDVDLLVPVSPVVNGKWLSRNFAADDPDAFAHWQATGVHVRHSDRVGEVREPWTAVIEWEQHDLLPEAVRITCPTLLITGEDDFLCPPSDVRELYNALGSQDKQLVVMQNTGHDFKSEAQLYELSHTIAEFLADQAKRSGASDTP